MVPDTNRREYTRATVRLESEVKVGETISIKGQLKDVSLSGMFMASSKTLPVGLECRAWIVLEGETQQIRVEASGCVVRVEEDGMGIEFTAIFGIESFTHLRNLIHYNHVEVEEIEKASQPHQNN